MAKHRSVLFLGKRRDSWENSTSNCLTDILKFWQTLHWVKFELQDRRVEVTSAFYFNFLIPGGESGGSFHASIPKPLGHNTLKVIFFIKSVWKSLLKMNLIQRKAKKNHGNRNFHNVVKKTVCNHHFWNSIFHLCPRIITWPLLLL